MCILFLNQFCFKLILFKFVKNKITITDIFREPFLGFSEDALNFLRKLKNPVYNNKKWFDKNRDIYEVYVKQPMRSLIDTLSGELRNIDENIVINHKSIFRINRDIRFSKDKTPYKFHYAASFCFGVIKKSDIPQFYFHFSPDEFIFAGGQYSNEPVRLKKIRNKIFDDYENFQDIITKKVFIKEYKKISGESLTRLPKEFEFRKKEITDKMLFNLLKMKQYYVEKTYKPSVIFDTGLVDLIKYHTKLMYEFVKFLNDSSI